MKFVVIMHSRSYGNRRIWWLGGWMRFSCGDRSFLYWRESGVEGVVEPLVRKGNQPASIWDGPNVLSLYNSVVSCFRVYFWSWTVSMVEDILCITFKNHFLGIYVGYKSFFFCCAFYLPGRKSYSIVITVQKCSVNIHDNL